MRRHLLLLFFGLVIPIELNAEQTTTSVQDFFSFLTSERYEERLGTRPDLIEKWLSPRVASYALAVECDAAVAWKEEQRPLSYIDAGIFFDRWDPPSQCQASEPETKSGRHTSLVKCQWGKGKDHPEGAKIELLVVLGRYGTQWKIENIKHHREEVGATKTDLLTRLVAATKQSSNPSYCLRKYGL